MYPRFLSKEYPLEEHLFFVTRYSFSLLGLHFERPMTWSAQIWLSFNIINLAYCTQAEFHFGWQHLSISTLDAMDAFCPLLCLVTTLFKFVYMLLYRNEVAQLIGCIRKLTELQNNQEQQNLKRLYYTRATRLGMWIFTLGSLTTLGFVLRSLWEMLDNFRSEIPFKYNMPFSMLFPAIGYRFPLYPLVYLFAAWSGQITVYSLTGTDGFFLGFTFYIIFLLKALKMDLMKALYEAQDPSSSECQLCCQRLVNIINRHNEIAEIVNKFSNMMSAAIFVQFVSSSLVLATSIVTILMLSTFRSLQYFIYSATVFSALMMYCLGGTQLTITSLEIGEAAYCCYWHCWNREVRRRVHMLILRSQRPMIIQVPFFEPSLPVLTKILKFTGSIVALVKTIM